jgi:hypothetical protein
MRFPRPCRRTRPSMHWQRLTETESGPMRATFEPFKTAPAMHHGTLGASWGAGRKVTAETREWTAPEALPWGGVKLKVGGASLWGAREQAVDPEDQLEWGRAPVPRGARGAPDETQDIWGGAGVGMKWMPPLTGSDGVRAVARKMCGRAGAWRHDGDLAGGEVSWEESGTWGEPQQSSPPRGDESTEALAHAAEEATDWSQGPRRGSPVARSAPAPRGVQGVGAGQEEGALRPARPQESGRSVADSSAGCASPGAGRWGWNVPVDDSTDDPPATAATPPRTPPQTGSASPRELSVANHALGGAAAAGADVGAPALAAASGLEVPHESLETATQRGEAGQDGDAGAAQGREAEEKPALLPRGGGGGVSRVHVEPRQRKRSPALAPSGALLRERLARGGVGKPRAIMGTERRGSFLATPGTPGGLLPWEHSPNNIVRPNLDLAPCPLRLPFVVVPGCCQRGRVLDCPQPDCRCEETVPRSGQGERRVRLDFNAAHRRSRAPATRCYRRRHDSQVRAQAAPAVARPSAQRKRYRWPWARLVLAYGGATLRRTSCKSNLSAGRLILLCPPLSRGIQLCLAAPSC